jgi:hypothetical protein
VAPSAVPKPVVRAIEIGPSWDLENEQVNTITSYRPLSLRPIRVLWARPTRAVLKSGLFRP